MSSAVGRLVLAAPALSKLRENQSRHRCVTVILIYACDPNYLFYFSLPQRLRHLKVHHRKLTRYDSMCCSLALVLLKLTSLFPLSLYQTLDADLEVQEEPRVKVMVF